MIPYLVIGVAALIGLFGWGITGLVIGGIGAFVFNMIFGWVLRLISGGLLPRRMRREVAVNFIASDAQLVEAACPGLTGAQRLKYVETAIERIFRRAIVDNPSMNLEAGWTHEAVEAATMALVDQESRPEMKAFLIALWRRIEQDMYPEKAELRKAEQPGMQLCPLCSKAKGFFETHVAWYGPTPDEATASGEPTGGWVRVCTDCYKRHTGEDPTARQCDRCGRTFPGDALYEDQDLTDPEVDLDNVRFYCHPCYLAVMGKDPPRWG